MRLSTNQTHNNLKTTAVSLAVCLVAAILEAALSGTNVKGYLASLTLPPFSPPLWAWYLIGAAYYVMCFAVLYRVIRHGRSGVWRNVAIALVMLLMVANAAWNWAFFRIQDPFVSFLVLVPYDAVVAALLVMVLRVDRMATLALLPYASYLVFANYWGYGVWRLNS